MKAVVFSEFGGPEVLRVADVPTPEPGPGEVRVKVHAASLNHLDLWVRRGLPIEITMPHIGGSDVAGVVDAVGAGVEGVVPGTRVVVDPSLDYDWYEGEPRGPGIDDPPLRLIGEHTQGGFAEYCVVPARNVVQLPDHVSYETAAAAGLVFVTAWHALIGRAGLKAGDCVLITGASGGVSTAAIQIARHAGAYVYAVTSGPDNVRRVRELGADLVYDRLEVDDWSTAVWNDTERRGVDIALDSVGGPVFASCLRALGVGGRLVTYGGTAGPRIEADVRLLFWKQLSIMGSTMGSPAEFRRVMRLVFEGAFAPVIHEVIPLEDLRRGHEMLEGGEVFGKLVVRP
ncbi:MAG: alcohol dehydrogenase [Gemmatimonadetes bacterium]|nr:MAG: alcohol dehydrogenase [Gemmatimonadota bacterium]